MHVRASFFNRIYNEIEKSRKKLGDFKKCEFHMHTPESKCYNLISGNSEEHEDEEKETHGFYHKMTTEEVIEYAKECGYLNDSKYKFIMENIDYYKSDEYYKKLSEGNIPFKDFKEYIAYMLIAFKLYKEEVDVAVISDHNTVKGFKKLKYAIKEYFEKDYICINKQKGIISLFLGVEISCSDLNHLVVIVDEEKYDSLDRYLQKIIMGGNLGSFYNTSMIVEELSKYDVIAYIAHVQSSNLYGNKVYNQFLFKSKGLKALGLTNIEKKDSQIQRIKNFTPDTHRFAFIHEGDSHSINEIGNKNTWIKFQKVNFKSLRKAIRNHQVCISMNEPIKTSKYIKGLVIETGKHGFLKSNSVNQENKYFNVAFSSDLNCIIGGKGTGKSTILNIIDIIYSQKSEDLQLLKFVSLHNRIFSVFIINEVEYLLEFIPQVRTKGYNNYISFFEKGISEKDGIYKLSDDWYNLYKIKRNRCNGKLDFDDVEKEQIGNLLNQVFKRGYNINKLVEKVDNGTVKEYIKQIVTYGIDYYKLREYLNEIRKCSDYRFISNLKNILPNIINELENRKVDIEDSINGFNTKNKDIILLDYRSDDRKNEYLDPFIQIFESKRNILNTGLRWYDLQKFFVDVTDKMGYLNMLYYLCIEDYKTIESYCNIKDYQNVERTIGTIDNEIEEVSNKNIKLIYKEILRRIRPKTNSKGFDRRKLLEESLINCFQVMDEINIKFNVNIKENINTSGKLFKNIEQLSSGQKVVAILTFLFQFGLISNDNTPLIIDQPEDNLDNAYIYNTLVTSLKEVKNNRQVIIVTHSSTIVTNANAEEVIVLESDNTKGWIVNAGYPTEDVITKHILNYLEGGIESFKHKMDVYSISINKLSV